MTDIETAARRLVDQIEGAGFVDDHGHAIESCNAYVELKALLDEDNAPVIYYSDDE